MTDRAICLLQNFFHSECEARHVGVVLACVGTASVNKAVPQGAIRCARPGAFRLVLQTTVFSAFWPNSGLSHSSPSRPLSPHAASPNCLSKKPSGELLCRRDTSTATTWFRRSSCNSRCRDAEALPRCMRRMCAHALGSGIGPISSLGPGPEPCSKSVP